MGQVNGRAFLLPLIQAKLLGKFLNVDLSQFSFKKSKERKPNITIARKGHTRGAPMQAVFFYRFFSG